MGVASMMLFQAWRSAWRCWGSGRRQTPSTGSTASTPSSRRRGTRSDIISGHGFTTCAWFGGLTKRINLRARDLYYYYLYIKDQNYADLQNDRKPKTMSYPCKMGEGRGGGVRLMAKFSI